MYMSNRLGIFISKMYIVYIIYNINLPYTSNKDIDLEG